MYEDAKKREIMNFLNMLQINKMRFIQPRKTFDNMRKSKHIHLWKSALHQMCFYEVKFSETVFWSHIYLNKHKPTSNVVMNVK